jgi:energy-coupling factor transporter ATP-binding protein EcfA2
MRVLRIDWLEMGFAKCAYCEQRITRADMHTCRYRPEAAARDWPKGEEYPEHYWWVAFHWQNLLPLCSHCTSLKRNFFPVRTRGQVGATWNELTREGGLLIDPFIEDPARSIDFDEDGRAIAKTERGARMIELLSLNRSELLARRKQAIRTLGSSDYRIVLITREFAGCLTTVLKSRKGKKAGSRAQQRITPTSPADSDSFQYIRKVIIRNFRTIESLTIEIPQTLTGSPTTNQGWKVVLGENSSGKSTVLKAIALALVGQIRVNELHLNSEDILRRWKGPNSSVGRARKGYIKLEFLNGLTHWVEFDRKGIRFKNGSKGIRGPIRAFGSMRLLPESDPGDTLLTGKSTDVQNLFNPRQSLLDAEKWLLSLKKPAFDAFAKALKALLGLERESDIECRDQRVHFHLNNAPIRLDELSDGYQCMVALAVDFMSGIPNVHEMEYAEGIVLLDELGTHLHPRWRMDFVRRFRECFRRVQVVATTHEPLCLLGLGQDEVMLLRRGPDGRVECLDTELPNPAGMRADQILTSPLFGLHSTIDPRLEELFQQYYVLLAIPDGSLRNEQRTVPGPRFHTARPSYVRLHRSVFGQRIDYGRRRAASTTERKDDE